jgi:enolase-phosphatase E1
VAPRAPRVRAVVLDVEGTTTPIAFVHDVLFPFARTRLREYLAAQIGREPLREVLQQLQRDRTDEVARGQHPPEWTPSDPDGVAAFVEWLMDRDRKAPGLKLLQGQIWERGFRDGTLRGELFPDVPAALRRWRDAGLDVAIYSSGSEQAQRLIFGSTAFGDLTGLISGFFDTAVGSKRSARSYRRIAEELGCATAEMLFISDVVAELDAAHNARCQVMLCVRPGNPPQTPTSYDVAQSFEQVLIAT